jgi:hypothetical protein
MSGLHAVPPVGAQSDLPNIASAVRARLHESPGD